MLQMLQIEISRSEALNFIILICWLPLHWNNNKEIFMQKSNIYELNIPLWYMVKNK